MKNTKKYINRIPEIVISLDIHANNIFLYALNTKTGEILDEGNIYGGYMAVLKRIKKFASPKKSVVLLEAGNQGFSPYRKFKRNKYKCLIIAPSSIPKQGKYQKTDKTDAISNLQYFLAGSLRFVDVPEEDEESLRECLRYRYQMIWKVTKQKQKIQSLLTRLGEAYSLSKTYWTQIHRRWLSNVDLSPLVRQVLNCMLDELTSFEINLKNLDTEIDKQVESYSPYARLINLYKSIPGIGRVSALTLIFEGRDLKRFTSPNALMSYTGLIPGKFSSGGKDPSLRITKAGNKYLRTILVGSSKYYRDRRLLNSKKKLAAYPAPLREFLIRCQDRLYARYKHLKEKGKHTNKARVAIAREMCGFVWELINKVLPVLKEKELAVI